MWEHHTRVQYSMLLLHKLSSIIPLYQSGIECWESLCKAIFISAFEVHYIASLKVTSTQGNSLLSIQHSSGTVVNLKSQKVRMDRGSWTKKRSVIFRPRPCLGKIAHDHASHLASYPTFLENIWVKIDLLLFMNKILFLLHTVSLHQVCSRSERKHFYILYLFELLYYFI